MLDNLKRWREFEARMHKLAAINAAELSMPLDEVIQSLKNMADDLHRHCWNRAMDEPNGD